MNTDRLIFVGDFETTVYKGQTETEVWASACVELGTENVLIFSSIAEQFSYFKSLNKDIVCYYHNLKFDGAFWLSYLLVDLNFKQGYSKGETDSDITWLKVADMPSNSVRYTISDMGSWYTIVIKLDKHYIELRDSLKLLPFSLRRIGDSFKTKHKKLDMKYEGYRYAGCTITPEERAYIANDVLVIKEALEIMFEQGHTKLTIGSCCLAEFQKGYDKYEYNDFFPDIYKIELNEEKYGAKNAGEYIRKSYKGGWCYLVKGKERKIYHNGTTADVNSLYPSMMSSESGNRYPIGTPHFWSGNYIPNVALEHDKYYFVRIRTRFYLKPNKLPVIQIKRDPMYKPNEWLETSDVWDSTSERWVQSYKIGSHLYDGRVTLTLTMTDYQLIKEQYSLVDFEILDGCWFFSEIGLFDKYIEKYKKIKLESAGALRELAKLFLNNLYGKMASSQNSSFKVAVVRDDKSIGFYTVVENNKKAGYIPIGTAITSYARNFTIRAAQKNYHGLNNRGFIYADTDSIHCDLEPNEIIGIEVHDKNFCCWKLESCWDTAIFTRQKTYIEHNTHADLKLLPKPWYNVKCAGMGDKSKALFIMSLTGEKPPADWELNEEEQQFISTPRTLKDFDIGLEVPSKLTPKRIKGGVLLCETTYKMR